MLRIMMPMVAALLFMGAATSALGAPVLLDRHPERVTEMVIAEHSRPDVERHAAVQGPWRIVHTVSGVRTWEAAIPVRPRTLFFHRPPSGMKLERFGKTAGAKKRKMTAAGGIENAAKANTWTFSADAIQVRRTLSEGPPTPGEYRVRYARAKEREQSLNRSMIDIPIADFVFRSLQVGDTTRHGLFLPAPSLIRYVVEVPEAGVLRFDASIVPPESALDGQTSDGATVIISAGPPSKASKIAEIEVSGTPQTHRIDLSAFAGSQVELVLESQGGPSNALDYVFLAEPTLYSPAPEARQMVLVFIDTLRPDAMSLYGYERPTSPKLDEWAKDAAVFTQARSVAPWTLPSARTMVTGTHPERWEKIVRLPDRLASHGWATGMIAGNVYLSSNFEMSEGWGTHRCINWPQGSLQINRGLSFLEDNADQDAFLLLHLMDMHLPYTEPIQYRSLFAGPAPEALGGSYFLRHDVTRAVRTLGDDAKEYVRGRYDNNMRYLDDQLERLFANLKDDAIVMIVSDHGEEFWDHAGFEHGHTLYDELLRIPMVLKAPGVEPGTFEAPTSLLDVAPTLAAVAGVDTAGMVGTDLRLLASGNATDVFNQRPQAFGRPLYGTRRWGSLENGIKFTVHEGEEEIFDVNSDPGETKNLIAEIDPTAGKTAIGTALERPVSEVWRLMLDKSRNGDSVRVTLRHPMAAAWVGDDPTMKGSAKVNIETDRTVARWPKQRGMVEVFLLPPEDTPDAIDIDITIGKRTETHTVVLVDRERPKAGKPDKLLDARMSGRRLKVTTSVAPIPSDLDSAIEGFDSEVAGDLESLGYIEKEEN